MSGFWRLLAVITALLAASGAWAQTPGGLPAGYDGRQFVDAAGCQFQRDDDGQWQARRGRDGAPLCGYPPTVQAEAPPAAGEDAAAAIAMDSSIRPPAATGAPAGEPAPDQGGGIAAPSPPAAQASPDTDLADAIARDAHIQPPEGLPPAQDSAPMDAAAAAALDATIRPPESGAQNTALPEAAPEPEAPVAQAAAQPAATAAKADAPRKARPARQITKPAKARSKPAKPARPRASPPEAHRYVQVGAFAEPSNARRAERRLAAMGLPVSHGKSYLKHQWLEVIMAGPFTDPDALHRTLRMLRQAGYPQAFTR